MLCWLCSLSPILVQPALEGVEVRCNLVLRPLLVIPCQWIKLNWSNVVLVNWTNVVLVKLTRFSVYLCLWLLSSHSNLTFCYKCPVLYRILHFQEIEQTKMINVSVFCMILNKLYLVNVVSSVKSVFLSDSSVSFHSGCPSKRSEIMSVPYHLLSQILIWSLLPPLFWFFL